MSLDTFRVAGAGRALLLGLAIWSGATAPNVRAESWRQPPSFDGLPAGRWMGETNWGAGAVSFTIDVDDSDASPTARVVTADREILIVRSETDADGRRTLQLAGGNGRIEGAFDAGVFTGRYYPLGDTTGAPITLLRRTAPVVLDGGDSSRSAPASLLQSGRWEFVLEWPTRPTETGRARLAFRGDRLVGWLKGDAGTDLYVLGVATPQGFAVDRLGTHGREQLWGHCPNNRTLRGTAQLANAKVPFRARWVGW